MSPAERSLLEHVRAALAEAQFDPTHASDIFLRADAEAALEAALPTAVIVVAGRDDARLPTARFLGATYRPDLLVELDTARVAVGLTLLRNDAGPLAGALAFCVLALWGPAARAQQVDGATAEREFHEQATRALAHGELDEAVTLASGRPETDPAAAALHGRTLVLRGLYDEARERLAPVAEAAPASAAGLELGLVLQRVGRGDEADPYLEAVLTRGLRSRRPVDKYRGGLAARALGRYRQANGLLRSAAIGAPEDPAIHTVWAELFLEKYNRADAVQSFTAALELDDPADRRRHLARWLVGSEHFARSLVNRVWAHFFGRGVVDPEDDLRATNPASNEALLSALTRDFMDHGHDVKRLIRTILNSATYQLSSTGVPANRDDEEYFSHHRSRRLPAEVVLDAMSQVTGVPEEFEGYPLGTRALQLPETQVESYFLDSFGRPPRLTSGADERKGDANVAQVLHLINGGTLNRKLRAEGGAVDRFLELELSAPELVERVYESALSRRPSQSEVARLVSALDLEQASREGVEDLFWAVLTSKEFLFTH